MTEVVPGFTGGEARCPESAAEGATRLASRVKPEDGMRATALRVVVHRKAAER
jgi:hypothetical protein